MKNKNPEFMERSTYRAGNKASRGRVKWSFLIVLFWGIALTLQAQVDEIGPRSLKMDIDGSVLRIPYFSATSVDSTNTAIRKVIIIVHGMNRNAGDYYRNMQDAASMSSHYTDSLLIVAPQFLEEEDLDPNSLDDSYLYWSSGWKSGSNSKNNSGHPRPARISSYAVMDTLMMRLAAHHPNLRFIILAGHSAGAQLVNRYAASSPVADKLFTQYGIKTRFIVANPSSYLYLDGKRAVQGTTDQFAVPSTSCSKYNNWRYGLDNLYSYPNQFGADSIRNMMKRREVIYLLGELDTDETSSSLDQSCQAELQGKNRLERGTIYYNYLVNYYGESIQQIQHRDTVPGVGHDNHKMFTSPVGRHWLFMSDPGEGVTGIGAHPDKVLKIYPNPASGLLHVEVSGHFKPACFSLFSTDGKVLIKQRNIYGNTFSIGLSNLPAGAYLLLLGDGKETVRKIFLKK